MLLAGPGSCSVFRKEQLRLCWESRPRIPSGRLILSSQGLPLHLQDKPAAWPAGGSWGTPGGRGRERLKEALVWTPRGQGAHLYTGPLSPAASSRLQGPRVQPSPLSPLSAPRISLNFRIPTWFFSPCSQISVLCSPSVIPVFLLCLLLLIKDPPNWLRGLRG